MEKQKYIALTIGPIYDTLYKVKSTRAIWTASCTFSYLVKQIVHNFVEPDSYTNFITPKITSDLINSTNDHAGLMPDRFIYCSNDATEFAKLQASITNTITSFGNLVFQDITNFNQFNTDLLLPINDSDKDKLIAFFLNYFRCCCVEIELDKELNPIHKINKILDTLELSPNNIGVFEGKLFFDWLELKQRNTYRNMLISNAFADFENRIDELRFSSVLEISTKEIGDKILNDFGKNEYWNIYNNEQESIFGILNHKTKIPIKRYHKYIAVIQADGDYMGTLLDQIFDDFRITKPDIRTRLTSFSQFLFQYAKNVVKTLENFGAAPVYVGGDDILAFSPIKYNNKTVFDLCKELDNEFYKTLNSFEELKELIPNLKNKPSLSFGVSIGYYKHPLGELVQDAYHLMRNKGKKFRNAFVFRILKHSGTPIEGILLKNEIFQIGAPKELVEASAFDFVIKLCNEITNASIIEGNTDEVNEFIASIQYKIAINQQLIQEQLIKETPDSLKYFFNNTFNESKHLGSKFLENVQLLLFYSFKVYYRFFSDENNLKSHISNNLKLQEEIQKNQSRRELLAQQEAKTLSIQTTISSLRFIQFITQNVNNE